MDINERSLSSSLRLLVCVCVSASRSQESAPMEMVTWSITCRSHSAGGEARSLALPATPRPKYFPVIVQSPPPISNPTRSCFTTMRIFSIAFVAATLLVTLATASSVLDLTKTKDFDAAIGHGQGALVE